MRGARLIATLRRCVQVVTGNVHDLNPAGAVGRSGQAALAFYESAFGARVLHRVGDGDGDGDGDDIVAQLTVDNAGFCIATTGSSAQRLVPRTIGGATGRLLLVVDDPDAMFARAVAAGAESKSAVAEEHGWRVGRLIDSFGHEWEIGKPLLAWPPSTSPSP